MFVIPWIVHGCSNFKMATPNQEQLKRLPLHDFHVGCGARLGVFGEWEVPLYYSGVLEEHLSVRNRVGIFDVSHMGEFCLMGSGARATLDHILPSRLDRLSPGKAIYSFMCNEDGGMVDDIVAYQLGEQRYLMVVNAGNLKKDFDWIFSHRCPHTEISDQSGETGLLSIQGPESVQLLERVIPSVAVRQMPYYSFLEVSSPWEGSILARTGYTGERGFEIFLRRGDLQSAYETLLEKGKDFGIKPIGFGARDTLRLEAGMLLYGQDMDEETTPLEAGLEKRVCFEKEFLGKAALVRNRERGLRKVLIGFEMVGRGVARHGCRLLNDGKPSGYVTSGSFSPSLKKNIGFAYLISPEKGNLGRMEIEIRDNRVEAKLAQPPFYRRMQRSQHEHSSGVALHKNA